jgi:hypothetical protein
MSGSDDLRSMAARLPDSDTPSDRLRNYEIAGSAHATPDELNFAAAPADIVKGGRDVPPMDCNEGPRSRFPNGPAFNAILKNLDTWVPTSTWFGNSTGASFCSIAGHEVPFDKARLKVLYPTHDAYVRAVTNDVQRLVAERALTKEDGDALIAEAKGAAVPF